MDNKVNLYMVSQVGSDGLKKLSTRTWPNLRHRFKPSQPKPPSQSVGLGCFQWVGGLDVDP